MKLVGALLSVLLVAGWWLWARLQPFSPTDAPAVSYQRIVSLAPSYTETVMGLGQEHRLVGVTLHCTSQKVAHAQKIGAFANLNLEAILALSPDLVLGVPHVAALPILNKLTELGVEVFSYQPDSLNDIRKINLNLSEKLLVPQNGLALNRKIDDAIMQAKNKLTELPLFQERRSVLILFSSSPMVAAGPKTFASEIMTELGFINQISQATITWPVWPAENLLKKPPHFLLVAEGPDAWPRYQKLFSTIGLLPSTHITILRPRTPIFSSPSHLLAQDILELTHIIPTGAPHDA
jgi:ABC-type hemin transport system substrate-binding protein